LRDTDLQVRAGSKHKFALSALLQMSILAFHTRQTLLLLRITGFLDFAHRPVFKKLENTTLRKLDLFPSYDEGGKAPAQLVSLEIGNLNH
jgi:hypothetical protein